jgi:hypothetical protein
VRELTARLSDRFAPWDSAIAVRLESPDLTPVLPGQFVLLGAAGYGSPILPFPALPWSQVAGTSLDLLFTEPGKLEGLEAVLRLDRPLRVFGPAGRGFSIDSRTRRALVMGSGEGLGSLLLLTTELLRRAADVTFISTAEHPERPAPAGALPHEVEYLTPAPERRLAQLEELLPWADALYLAVAPPLLPEILTLLRRRLLRLPKGFAQALVRPVLVPCGVGACDLCIIETTKGYRRACRNGLVFDLPSLI